MNILVLFVIIPLLTLLALWGSRNLRQTRAVMVIGSTLLLALSVYLTVDFISQRSAGDTAPMLYTASVTWFEPLNICFSMGVDGISVAMLLLSSIIVFTGTFASWRIKPMTKDFFLWYMLLSLGVYGFFISTDLFTMFMFYETALIPMYLLIGVWQNMGWGTILYLSAITGINMELFEAAKIDGANKMQQIWHVTLPGIRSTIVVLLILNVGQMMNISFDRPFILGNPQVRDYGDVLSTFVYRTGITNAKFDRATAIGLFQSVVGLILISGANFITKKMGEDGIW